MGWGSPIEKENITDRSAPNEVKPTDCTCDWPVVSYPNGHGHHPSCPFGVRWNLLAQGSGNPMLLPDKPMEYALPATNITVAITEQIGAVSVTFMAASTEQLAELMENQRIRKSMKSGGEN